MTTARPTLRIVAVLLLAALSLSACGKKPRTVDPPQGKDADTFPQIYPNPAFDPKSGQPQPVQPQSGQPQSGQPQSSQPQSSQGMPGEIIPGWKFP